MKFDRHVLVMKNCSFIHMWSKVSSKKCNSIEETLEFGTLSAKPSIFTILTLLSTQIWIVLPLFSLFRLTQPIWGAAKIWWLQELVTSWIIIHLVFPNIPINLRKSNFLETIETSSTILSFTSDNLLQTIAFHLSIQLQKKFYIYSFCSKYDQTTKRLRIWSHLL